jgi:hypothetical protein
VIRHPATGAFFISEVYPVIPQGYDDTGGGNPDNISDNTCFDGTDQTTPNVTVTPGVFCLGPTTNFRIDVNRFATCPSGYGSPYVQSFRLTKTVPGSQKVPNCYPPQQYIQFGAAGIRTWWALKYTQPGTTFVLEVTVRCLQNGSTRGRPEIHMDRWVWQVGVEVATLGMVIDMLHSSALSVMEFPCIADERVYADLKQLARNLREAAALTNETQRQLLGRAAIMDLEFVILSECVWVDFVAPEFARGDGMGFTRPPGNLPSGTDWTPFDDEEDGGIIDSLENPCCCKLMVDVEYISNNLGFSDLY